MHFFKARIHKIKTRLSQTINNGHVTGKKSRDSGRASFAETSHIIPRPIPSPLNTGFFSATEK